jgi:hypothetical protein
MEQRLHAQDDNLKAVCHLGKAVLPNFFQTMALFNESFQSAS